MKERKFSIKKKVALLCTGFILTAVIINYIVLVMASKSTITDNTEETLKELAAAYSLNVENSVNRISEQTNFMMNSDSVVSYVNSGGTDGVKETEEFISMFLNMNSYSEEISIVDATGSVLLSSDPDKEGSDLSGETYFQQMQESVRSTQSEVYLSESSGEPCITFAVPLMGGAPPEGEKGTMEFNGAIIMAIKVSALSDTLSGITVGGNQTGYAYLMDSQGTIIYHPDSEKIGSKVENTAMNQVVEQIQSETASQASVVTYTYDGAEKYAGYAVNETNHWILVVTAAKSEILASFTQLSLLCLVIGIVVILILTVLAYIFAGTITKPIQKITSVVNKTAMLDLTVDSSYEELGKRRDETGEMSRSIQMMREMLRKIILQISEASGHIQETAKQLDGITNTVNEHTCGNSATAEELSAGMEETAATTEVISTDLNQVNNMSQEMNEKVREGEHVSEDLIERAAQLKTSAGESTEKTRRIYESVRLRTDAAIEQSKAVDNINVLTDAIKDIASQTSLLALNASIEAARAGDAGRGFSVVAGEISSLADQSARTVSGIQGIVEEVHKAVDNMADSLKTTLDFLEGNVLKDYQEFKQISDQYNTDAVSMNEMMKNICTRIEESSHTMQTISRSVSEINSMMGEATEGVNDVAHKNADIVGMTSATHDMVKENINHAKELQAIVEEFKL